MHNQPNSPAISPLRQHLTADEFIRRFLLYVLPCSFHRIRHYGLFASGARKANLAFANDQSKGPDDFRPPCSCCGRRMIVIEVSKRWRQPRGPRDTHNDPGALAMTRHGMALQSAADARSSAINLRVLSIVIAVDTMPL